MTRGIVISDAGPIFSLAVLGRLDLLDLLFEYVKIPRAVWNEIIRNPNAQYTVSIENFFSSRVVDITGVNNLKIIMDHGESEAVLLYQEIDAELLLIDDKKARSIAENLQVKCVGTIGILMAAKEKGLMHDLKPAFEKLITHNRYYSLRLLNKVLRKYDEDQIIIK